MTMGCPTFCKVKSLNPLISVENIDVPLHFVWQITLNPVRAYENPGSATVLRGRIFV